MQRNYLQVYNVASVDIQIILLLPAKATNFTG